MKLMYEGEPGEIRTDAYHGTNLTSALSILESGFIPHLGIAGVGVYFDLGDDSSANERALEKADGILSRATVIQAELHLGNTVEINFQRNPTLANEFREFQEALRIRLGRPLSLNFNEQKEMFLCERYPNINSVYYFNVKWQCLTVAVRDTNRIKILAANTLTGRSLIS